MFFFSPLCWIFFFFYGFQRSVFVNVLWCFSFVLYSTGRSCHNVTKLCMQLMPSTSGWNVSLFKNEEMCFLFIMFFLIFCLFDWLVLLFVSVLFVMLACCYILFCATASRHVYHLFTPWKDHYTSVFFSIKSLCRCIYHKPMWEIRKKSISYRNLIWMIKGKCKCMGVCLMCT